MISVSRLGVCVRVCGWPVNGQRAVVHMHTTDWTITAALRVNSQPENLPKMLRTHKMPWKPLKFEFAFQYI